MDSNLKFWQRNAKLYAPIQERGNRVLYGIVMPRCGAYIDPGTQVLELACGSGQFTLPLSGMAKSWEATDYSPNMIREAQKRNIPRAHFCTQDATALTYEDGSFDLVLIANALHVMPEPEKALQEIHRVLRSGGILLAPTFVYEGDYSRLRLHFMELMGFKSFYKWTTQELADFVAKQGYEILEQELIPSQPVPEGFLAARKN